MYTATVTETTYRKHKCQHCGQKFAYVMARSAFATSGTGFTGTDDAAIRKAKQEAENRVRSKLAHEFECIPCLGCGEFQDEMVEELKRRATRGRYNWACGLGFFALAGVFVSAVITFALFKAKDPKANAYLICGGAWIVTALAGLPALGLFAVWLHACKKFDPYGGRPMEFWKARAKKMGAVTPEELAIIQEEQRRLKAEEAAEAAEREGNLDFSGEKPEAEEEAPDDKPWARGRRKPKPAAASPPASPPPAPAPASAPPPPAARPAEKNPFDFG